MRRTSPAVLALAGVLGLGAGFVVNQLLTASGNPTFTPLVTLPILLVLLGALVLALAIPIRRSTRGQSTAPVDPFRAVRIAVLAKAASIVGAAVGGIALGLLLFLVTRPVVPSVGSTGAIIATIVAGAALVAAALVAEGFCTIGKDDDDDQPGAEEAGGGTVAH